MARYTKSRCKLCRREAIREDPKMFLKSERCYTDKCAIERRPFPPGQHGSKKGKLSGYGIRVREKQKAKRIYGVLERQFREYFYKAKKKEGITGEHLMVFLERRLDNVVYRLGFAKSRSHARQLVAHGHFLVNGRRTDIPSYLVRVGDEIQLKERSRNNKIIAETFASKKGMVPKWLEVDEKSFKGIVKSLPERKDITDININEQLIVELYSR
ncbi:MAG: 30S ribosomal protein S4 [Deltaproteobacteria bacterium]|nr:30S ribosomal protein S4 [Deltaproteobacteria bacterium]